MARYMVLYRASITAPEQMANATPEQARAGMDAWMEWANKVGSALIDMGSPLGEGRWIGAVPKDTNHIAGYSILQADSMEAALKLLEDHPHLHTPGDTAIEVHEFISMPGG